MRHFYLVENKTKGKIPRAAEIIKDYLGKNNAQCMETRGYAVRDEIPRETECIIVLGGDGTMIRTATDTAGLKIPMIGVNMGHFGYLTSVSKAEEIIPMLDALLNDEFRLEKRIMLEGYASHKTHNYAAMNELVIGRKSMQKAVRLKVYVDEEFLNEYTADGIIIATPTGSTAYNLSAGGPIVQSDMDVMVVTPICPHVLVPGSIVVSGKSKIEVEIAGGDPDGQMAVFDGVLKEELVIGSKVTVRKSKSEAVFIRLNNDSFVKSLEKKIQ